MSEDSIPSATKRCPYCAEEVLVAAVKCRHCGSWLGGGVLEREWYRVRRGKMIAGVCTGLAEMLGMSVTAIRLGAVVLAWVSLGLGVLAYLALWLIMPYREEP